VSTKSDTQEYTIFFKNGRSFVFAFESVTDAGDHFDTVPALPFVNWAHVIAIVPGVHHEKRYDLSGWHRG
jgi:hypothetical protein